MRKSLLVIINHIGGPALTESLHKILQQFGRVDRVQPMAFLIHTKIAPEKIKTAVRGYLDSGSVCVVTITSMI